jgi:acetoin utilization deacetylase AcuC-like enzyme
VAVVDFDVHHGNGTQACLEQDPTIFFASSHQSPCYPGTGAAEERGVGNIFNATLPPGADGAAFRAAWRDQLLPALDAFGPELVVISAGFDAHARDPLAQLRVREGDFAWLTTELCQLADRACGGRVVSLLEGGYDLDALALSTAAHVRALMHG